MRVNVIYLDDNNNVVDEKDATHSVFQTYDDNGNLIEENIVYNGIQYDKHNEKLNDDDFDRILDEECRKIRAGLK